MLQTRLTQTAWRAIAGICILLLVVLVALPYRSSAIPDLGNTILGTDDGITFESSPSSPSKATTGGAASDSAAAPSTSQPSTAQTSDRPLILYAYADTDNARHNLEFFLQRGLHGKADFVFIFNGPTNATELIPRDLENVRVVERDNTCFDLGSYGQVLMKDDLWKKYKRFLLINASVRGPFLPVYSGECWSDVFFRLITDKVKLAGLSLNCGPRPHVQSMVLATDAVGMGILLDSALGKTLHQEDHWGGLDDGTGLAVCFETLFKAVHAEIGLTELIRSQGYEVDVMMTAFHAATSPTKYCEEFNNPPDVQYDKMYFGTNIHPYETVFFKANRNIDPVTLQDLTDWHLRMKSKAWDTCGR